MAHHRLLIWIISDRYLGSTGFFQLFAGRVWRGTVFLSFMSGCYLFSIPVAPDFCLWNASCMLGPMWKMGRLQCVVAVGHHAGCRPRVKGTGQLCSWRGLCSMVWCHQHGEDMVLMSGQPVPTVELPAWHASWVPWRGRSADFAASHWGWAPAGVSGSCAHIPVCWQAPENKKKDCP